jgi:hypothetical protein
MHVNLGAFEDEERTAAVRASALEKDHDLRAYLLTLTAGTMQLQSFKNSIS